MVDQKKLEKAEAKIKAKQERRAVKDAKDLLQGGQIVANRCAVVSFLGNGLNAGVSVICLA